MPLSLSIHPPSINHFSILYYNYNHTSTAVSSSSPLNDKDDSHDDFKPKVKKDVSPVHVAIEKDINSHEVSLIDEGWMDGWVMDDRWRGEG